MMAACKRCHYDRKAEKGERLCLKCGKPENVHKSDWLGTMLVGGNNVIGPIGQYATAGELREVGYSSIEDLLGDPPEAKSVRPVHSRYGGSSAKRWMNCPGSVALIAKLPPRNEEDDPEFTKGGKEAHALAAHCLENELDAWEALADYPRLKFEDAGAIQQYLDYVRSLPGRRDIETRFHRPQLHPDFYGTIDAAVYSIGGTSGRVLEIVDFKFGQGVFVPIEKNEQLLYYAAGYITDDPDFWSDESVVRLTIAQPRQDWVIDAIRSWDTTVGEIKRWLYEECLPSMIRDCPDEFKLGDWCQFCPAKLICPAQRWGVEELDHEVPTTELSDKELGQLFEMSERVKTYQKALRDEVLRRMMDRRQIPGVKLVAGKADRVWKEGVDLPKVFGKDAWQPPKLVSPAMAEKLPGGKTVVAEWAYKPETSPTIALAGDPRAEVTLATASQVFANVALGDDG